MTSAYNYNTQINQSNKLLQKYLDKNLLGMTSACLNPVLYGFLNESYKKEFKVDFHLNSNFLHTCWEHIVKIIQFGSILFFSVIQRKPIFSSVWGLFLIVYIVNVFLSRKCGPLSQDGKDVDESLTRWKLFLVMVNEVLWKRLFFVNV